MFLCSYRSRRPINRSHNINSTHTHTPPRRYSRKMVDEWVTVEVFFFLLRFIFEKMLSRALMVSLHRERTLAHAPASESVR